jgi:hypothetical protein
MHHHSEHKTLHDTSSVCVDTVDMSFFMNFELPFTYLVARIFMEQSLYQACNPGVPIRNWHFYAHHPLMYCTIAEPIERVLTALE